LPVATAHREALFCRLFPLCLFLDRFYQGASEGQGNPPLGVPQAGPGFKSSSRIFLKTWGLVSGDAHFRRTGRLTPPSASFFWFFLTLFENPSRNLVWVFFPIIFRVTSDCRRVPPWPRHPQSYSPFFFLWLVRGRQVFFFFLF